MTARVSARTFRVETVARGQIKQALVKIGFPAEGLAGYTEGTALPLQLRTACRSGPFALRPYGNEKDAYDR